MNRHKVIRFVAGSIVGRLSFLFLSVTALCAAQFITPLSASAHPSHQILSSQRSLITVHDALTTACPQFSRGTDLMNLSDAQLQYFGLPTQLELTQNPGPWRQAFSQLKHLTCGLDGTVAHFSPGGVLHQTSTLRAGHSVTPYSLLSGCTQWVYPGHGCENYSWAGNIAEDNNRDRGIYNEAYVTFNIPTIGTSVSGENVSQWAGVGGDGYVTSPQVLVQAGVEEYESTLGGTQSDETWWEVAPYTQPINLPVGCGGPQPNDLMYIYVASNKQGSGYDYFYIEDEHTGCANRCYLSTGGSIPGYNCGISGSQYNADDATGECIVERNGNPPSPLASYRSTGMTGNTQQLQYCGVNTAYIGNQSHSYMNTCNYTSCSYEMQSTGGIYQSGEDFNVTWDGHYT